ncbi:hypothetical protein PROFUN_00658 [Planoprotostelium fungivorum]|uniref:Uncharacterized protein n=1 Tax=Planoprotostelium fungivorum TaxID=1890364 RepID=A0A2P6NTZ2_9EUKA|nr:hypothetical protein PROFUN_00658 [Planoprotostelium fungivorum]
MTNLNRGLTRHCNSLLRSPEAHHKREEEKKVKEAGGIDDLYLLSTLIFRFLASGILFVCMRPDLTDWKERVLERLPVFCLPPYLVPIVDALRTPCTSGGRPNNQLEAYAYLGRLWRDKTKGAIDLFATKPQEGWNETTCRMCSVEQSRN